MKSCMINTLTFLLILTGITSVGFASESEEQVRRFIELTGLNETLSSLPEQLMKISEQRILESDDPKTEQEIANIMVESFDSDQAEKILISTLLKSLDTNILKKIIQWLETPLVQKISKEESFSSDPEMQDEYLEYINELQTNPPSMDRINIIEDFVTTLATAGIVISITTQIMRGFLLSDNHRVPQYDKFNKISIEKEIPKIGSMIREPIKQQMILFSLYLYRNVSNDELKEYINFHKSDIGRKKVIATFNALNKATKEWIDGAEEQVVHYIEDNKKIVHLSLEEENQLVIKAKKLLDDWFGRDEFLIEAKEIIDRILASNPNNYQAYKELARYYIMAGTLSMPVIYAQNTEISLEKAEKALNKAISINPDYGDGYVLFGHLYTKQKKYDLAEKALEKANELTNTNPWLYLNWADLFKRQGKVDEGIKKVNLAVQIKTENLKVLGASYSLLIDLYEQKKDYEKVNDLYIEYINAFSDTNTSDKWKAWRCGNYSAFLRNTIGDFDKALEYALKAREYMDYDIGRLNIALALYLKWAQTLEESNDINKATEYFDKAYDILPDLNRVMRKLGRYNKTQIAVKHLINKGVSIEAPDEKKGYTTLYDAAYEGQYDAVKNLLELGANPNYKSFKGFTPFYIAIYMGHKEIVQLMLQYNAKDFIVNGRSAVAVARFRNHSDIEKTLFYNRSKYK